MTNVRTSCTVEEEFRRILGIMARLRDPSGGCPWDLEQTFATIAPHTIEEAYEVAEAIEAGDPAALKAELGDLLFQVVFHSQMAHEAGRFDFGDVLAGLNSKMVERHPHVFGDSNIADSRTQADAWEHGKARARAQKAQTEGRFSSALDGVTIALPALTRAAKIQNRAARVGFDWPEPRPVLDKIREEVTELEAAIKVPGEPTAIRDEIGDLLFAIVNLARHLDVDAEGALRGATAKFERRFHRVEAILRQAGLNPEQAGLDRMETAWNRTKTEEIEI